MAKAKRYMYEFPRVGEFTRRSNGHVIRVITPGARVSGAYQDFASRDAVCLGEIGSDGQVVQAPPREAEQEESNT